MAEERDRSFDYDYDGIQEFDNPLPRWWVFLLVGTMIFAAVYVPWYHLGPGTLPREDWAADMAEWERLHPPVPLPDETELAAMASDAATIERGRTIFATRCVACHASDGGGQVGPNLCDDYSIHGWSRARIAQVVHDGVPAKGMIAWGQQLSREDLLAVALFAYQLRGTQPANPKAPQGDPIGGALALKVDGANEHATAGSH